MPSPSASVVPLTTAVMFEMKRLCLSVLSMGYSFNCTSFMMQKDKHELLSVTQDGKKQISLMEHFLLFSFRKSQKSCVLSTT